MFSVVPAPLLAEMLSKDLVGVLDVEESSLPVFLADDSKYMVAS